MRQEHAAKSKSRGKNGLAVSVPDDALDSMMVAAGLAYDWERFEEALKVYRGVSLARPEWSTPIVGSGTALYRLGRLEEAEAAYREALGLDPDDQEANCYLGELIWNHRKDRVASSAYLTTAAELQPNSKIGLRSRYILSLVRSSDSEN